MLARKYGGGYDESVNSASYSVSDISYTGDAKSGDRLDISKIQITLTCVDASNSNQTYSSDPKGAYDHLKQKGASFSLTITANGEKVISFGDENFPETHNPFTFDAGTTTISISGTIGGNEVNSHSSIYLAEQGTNLYSIEISGIAYACGAKVGDELNLSNIEITLKADSWDEEGEYKKITYKYSPSETYTFLKSQSIYFSLSIATGEETFISFGSDDGQFPECVPFTFKEEGTVPISVSGTIGGNPVSESASLEVEAKKRAESYEALLKMILGEEKYNEIKANLVNLNLTAALIKEVGEKYPAIMASDEHDATVIKYAEGFVAQSLGMINATKETCNYPERTYYKITFADDTSLKVGAETFDLNEIEIINNDKIDFTDATFIGQEIEFPKINQARGPYLPTLGISEESPMTVTAGEGDNVALEIFKVYNEYTNCLDKVHLKG